VLDGGGAEALDWAKPWQEIEMLTLRKSRARKYGPSRD
jgi:hypothetical protein